MNIKVYDAIYNFYKNNYDKIEKEEIYKWRAVEHFQRTWDIEAEDFAMMLENALKKTSNLMSSGNYYPRKMITWAAKKEPEKVRELFRDLYDLSKDIKNRIKNFKLGIDEIVKVHKEGTINEIYIEVKTTSGAENNSIFITANELKMSEECPKQYYLYRVFNFDKINMVGDISVKKGSLKDLCISAQTYKVNFK